MPPSDLERIAILETKVNAIKDTLKDIDEKLDRLPLMIANAIEKATKQCQESQQTKCALLHKSQETQLQQNKPKSGAAGWIAAAFIGISNGIYYTGKSWGWW